MPSSRLSVETRVLIASPIGIHRPVDRVQECLTVVVVDQGRRLLVVLDEPVADHLGVVVIADDQLGAVDVADALLLGRAEVDVVDVVVLGADPPAREPPDDLVVVDVDQDDGGQLLRNIAELPVECLGLGHGPREAVEDEAVVGLAALQSVGDHPDDHFVGDEIAPVHVFLRLLAHLGALADGEPEHVARGVVRKFEILLQALALGPLAGAGWSEEYEVQIGHGCFPVGALRALDDRNRQRSAGSRDRGSLSGTTAGSLRSCASSTGPRAA